MLLTSGEARNTELNMQQQGCTIHSSLPVNKGLTLIGKTVMKQHCRHAHCYHSHIISDRPDSVKIHTDIITTHTATK